jgi:molecular chaperone IbpA
MEDLDMTTYDLSPLFRSSVGFDRLIHLMDDVFQKETESSYPPYNIEKKDEENYIITMAVAGFKKEMITITVQDNGLFIEGRGTEEDNNKTYIHRGIGKPTFERKFQLADFMKVGDASLEDGLLTLHLYKQIPETMKPRTITIRSGESMTSFANRMTIEESV